MNLAWTAFIHVPAVRDSGVTTRIAFGACMNCNQRAVSPFAGQVTALHARRLPGAGLPPLAAVVET
jgi:hypothetical protein